MSAGGSKYAARKREDCIDQNIFMCIDQNIFM